MQFQALENTVLMEIYEVLKLGKYCVSLQSNTQVAKPRHLLRAKQAQAAKPPALAQRAHSNV